MALDEFGLIARYFQNVGASRHDVALGVGDDGAVLVPPPGEELVAVTDTLVEGVHFPRGSSARSVGHRALAVNLSDLAAMGAQPAWVLLALTLPAVDEPWLQEFAAGFSDLAQRHGVRLVGGDTTSGPLSVTVHALGFTRPGAHLRRAGGSPGDWLFVSGSPGDSTFGLSLEQGTASVADVDDDRTLRDRFLFPTPRVELGRRLVGVASACIDVSDGLGGDLAKLASASGCGAQIGIEYLPISGALWRNVSHDDAVRCALTGGEDFELLFSVPESRVDAVAQVVADTGVACAEIGRLESAPGVRVNRKGIVTEFSHSGFDHFRVMPTR